MIYRPNPASERFGPCGRFGEKFVNVSEANLELCEQVRSAKIVVK
jgi:hypothetical protein